MSALSIVAPAKLNLYLRVLYMRADAYHEIQTAFQFIDLCDQLELQTLKNSAIELSINDDDLRHNKLHTDDNNSAVRAARLLQTKCGVKRGARIHIHKRIPAGAGLGGGSSNAASVLLGLNALWSCGLNNKQLASMGRYLGADVPVFVHGVAATATGAGDLLSPKVFPEYNYLLLIPAEVSTAKLFALIDVNYNQTRMSIANMLESTENSCLDFACDAYPEVAKALSWLNQHGKARLTGTGGGVFAYFENMSKINALLTNVPDSAWFAFAVRGLNSSPAHLQTSKPS